MQSKLLKKHFPLTISISLGLLIVLAINNQPILTRFFRSDPGQIVKLQ